MLSIFHIDEIHQYHTAQVPCRQLIADFLHRLQIRLKIKCLRFHLFFRLPRIHVDGDQSLRRLYHQIGTGLHVHLFSQKLLQAGI